MDYYMNDAGLLVAETTIAQTDFDITGLAVASRIRQALQYADTIDEARRRFSPKDNNGLYTNEWLLADIKTNEIAMFELGTHKSKLWRSSKNEWLGGTEGFYWGCNNTKDLEVRLETVASLDGRPANLVFQPTDRDRTWLRLFAKHRGKIDRRLRLRGVHDAAPGRLSLLRRQVHHDRPGQGAEDLGPVRPAAGPHLDAQ